ncbi:MAG: protein jag [Thermoleophilaceae bacterium]
MDGEADTRADGRGANLGEAKWKAVKELERRFPGLTPEVVEFEVVEDSEASAHVRAEVDVEAWESSSLEVPAEPAERVRAVVTRVVAALGLDATVDVEESPEEIRATVNGPDDLGRLIGRHGQTIDALQHLAWRAAFHDVDERKSVVVDAAGYRRRREEALQRQADRAASEALRFGRPVELEPMSAPERKIVHNYLAESHDVETHSEGDEPERRLVVSPLRGEGA